MPILKKRNHQNAKILKKRNHQNAKILKKRNHQIEFSNNLRFLSKKYTKKYLKLIKNPHPRINS